MVLSFEMKNWRRGREKEQEEKREGGGKDLEATKGLLHPLESL